MYVTERGGKIDIAISGWKSCRTSQFLLLETSLTGQRLRSTAVEGGGGGRRRRSCGATAAAASQMNWSTCVYYCWSLMAVAVMPACVGEMYTSLLNVKQAIAVERRLIEHLRTYIDHELERLDDVRRWVAHFMTDSAVHCFEEFGRCAVQGWWMVT